MRRTALIWSVAAVIGVLLVAGVTVATSQLSSQSIGISEEPPSAGDELTPQTEEVLRTDEPARDGARRDDGRRSRDDRRRARDDRRDDRAAGTGGDASVEDDGGAVAGSGTSGGGTGTGDDDPPEIDDDDNSGTGSSDDSSGSSDGDDDSGHGRGRGRGRGGDDDD